MLNVAETNYCATRKELLAIVRAEKHFHSYLYGRKFVVRTDHADLTWSITNLHQEGQAARWTERLSGYQVDIIHRSEKQHQNADGLS